MPPVTTKQNIAAIGRRQPPIIPHRFRHPVRYQPRMNGLGITTGQAVTSTQAGLCIAAAIATGGAAAIGCLPQVLSAFMSWLTCGPTSACALKISATQFAEGIVRLCYGWEPGCTLPTHGEVPIVPGANPPLFCSSSVAGLIERCDLYNANIVLQRAQQLMQQKLSVTGDPVTPYVQRWYDQYGIPTFADLNSHLAQAKSQCVSAATQPPPANQYPGGIVPLPPVSSGIGSYTPYLILGGILLFGVFMMNR